MWKMNQTHQIVREKNMDIKTFLFLSRAEIIMALPYFLYFAVIIKFFFFTPNHITLSFLPSIHRNSLRRLLAVAPCFSCLLICNMCVNSSGLLYSDFFYVPFVFRKKETIALNSFPLFC